MSRDYFTPFSIMNATRNIVEQTFVSHVFDETDRDRMDENLPSLHILLR